MGNSNDTLAMDQSMLIDNNYASFLTRTRIASQLVVNTWNSVWLCRERFDHFFSFSGIPPASPAKGRLQASTDQLLGPNECQSDAEYHPIQAGQEEEGRLWTSSRLEDRELLYVQARIKRPLMFHIH